ncbi:protein phosphatase PTC7 homolog [Penaeus indicus]|uniref:protein phosphatase PTC7 homolog n=2 Tax=Penaeus TaxID=133894 RepID=UPI00300BFA50
MAVPSGICYLGSEQVPASECYRDDREHPLPPPAYAEIEAVDYMKPTGTFALHVGTLCSYKYGARRYMMYTNVYQEGTRKKQPEWAMRQALEAPHVSRVSVAGRTSMCQVFAVHAERSLFCLESGVGESLIHDDSYTKPHARGLTPARLHTQLQEAGRSHSRLGVGQGSWHAVSPRLGPTGVADGVGGWRAWGIDPGEFSNSLMRVSERLVRTGSYTASDPAAIIARAYYELLENKTHILGSSTACVVVLQGEAGQLYSANIGDSGFLVVRDGSVVHRSQEQQHYFNTPFQLSLPPPGTNAQVLSDRPESAETREFSVKEGDVLMVATDGVFDNLPDSTIVKEMVKVQGSTDLLLLQQAANSIAQQARKLAFDEDYMSPFARNARENGINAIGGKPDDITVVLATITL